MEMALGFTSPASEEGAASLLRESLLFQGSTVGPEIRVEDQPQRRPSLMEPKKVRFPSEMPESLTQSPRSIVPPLVGPHTIETPSVRPFSAVTSHMWTPVIPPRVLSPSGSSDRSERAHSVRTSTSVPPTPGTPWATSTNPWKIMTPTPSLHDAGTPSISTQQQPSSNTHAVLPVCTAIILSVTSKPS